MSEIFYSGGVVSEATLGDEVRPAALWPYEIALVDSNCTSNLSLSLFAPKSLYLAPAPALSVSRDKHALRY